MSLRRKCLCGAWYDAIVGPGRPRTTCDACRKEIWRIYQAIHSRAKRYGSPTVGLHAAAIDEWRRIHTDNSAPPANVEWRGIYGRNWDNLQPKKEHQ